MTSRSSLARLQQVLVLSLLAAAISWMVFWWPRSVAVAVLGAAALSLSHAAILAVEFVALRVVGRRDSAPRPAASELLRAWLLEATTAIRVFGWRQPFCWKLVPDRTDGARDRNQRPIVFVHGFVCNRGFWMPWLERAAHQGHAFVAVNLEPVFGSIDDYVPVIERAVQDVRAATGVAPVLVCHSMGGLAARAWLRSRTDKATAVQRVVTIGTPHRGTWLARFSHLPNGRQMRLSSRWLQQLERDEAGQPPVPFTCWYSNCDNIVFPVQTAALPGADNRLVLGQPHVDLAFHPRVMDETFALIQVTGSASPSGDSSGSRRSRS